MLNRLFKTQPFGEFPVAQWLQLCPFSAEGLSSIPGQGTKIPQAVRHGKQESKQINK